MFAARLNTIGAELNRLNLTFESGIERELGSRFPKHVLILLHKLNRIIGGMSFLRNSRKLHAVFESNLEFTQYLIHSFL